MEGGQGTSWGWDLMVALSCFPWVLILLGFGSWGPKGKLGIRVAGGKGYSSLCSTEIKFRATGFPAGLKTKVSK